MEKIRQTIAELQICPNFCCRIKNSFCFKLQNLQKVDPPSPPPLFWPSSSDRLCFFIFFSCFKLTRQSACIIGFEWREFVITRVSLVFSPFLYQVQMRIAVSINRRSAQLRLVKACINISLTSSSKTSQIILSYKKK